MELTYTQAIEELETINRKLADNRIPIDELRTAARRAAELIDHCRKVLNETDGAIQTIIQEINLTP